MRLWAISDLHVAVARNAAALRGLPAYPEDWLIVAGDLCEEPKLFGEALQWLAGRVAPGIWVPGNHEPWPGDPRAPHGGRPGKYIPPVDAPRPRGGAAPGDQGFCLPPSRGV